MAAIENPKRSARDGRVELLRVLACLAVVALHAKSNTFVEGVPVYPRVLFSCFVSDAVAVFWLIMGFYIFKAQSYRFRLRHCFFKIVLPMLLFSLFLIFLPVVKGGEFSFRSLYPILESVISWESKLPLTGHFWFLFVYIAIVLLFPVLDAIRTRFLSDSAGRRRFLITVLCLFALNDLTFNRLLRVDQIPITALIPSALIVLSGYALYEERDALLGSKNARLLGLALFLGANVLRSVPTYFLLQVSSGYTHLLYWCSSFGFTSCVGLAVFLLSFKRRDGALSRAAALLGSCTMAVYIIHPWLISIGLNAWVASLVCNGAETFDQYIKFIVCMTLAIFLIGAAVSIPFTLIRNFFKGKVRRNEEKDDTICPKSTL